jgi:hypothetical protein
MPDTEATTTEHLDPVIHWEDHPWAVIEPVGTKLRLMAVKGGELKGEPAIAIIEYGPNVWFPRHKHDVPHIEIVVSGVQWVGDREERAGTVRWVPANYFYGPLRMGPEGARIIEVFPDGNLPAIFGELEDMSELEDAMGIGMDGLLEQLVKITG